MIRSIEKLKKFGVYQNYVKPSGIEEFSNKNLIYGWNYSGKTTLSRLFAKLESKAFHPDFKDCEFSFNAGDDSINEKNFHESKLFVRVFNSDFVKNNIFFDSGSCNPILLLGKESEEAQKKIESLSIRIRKSQERFSSINRSCEAYANKIKEEKTKAAQFIRQRLKLDPYTAIHLGQDVARVAILDTQPLPEKELGELIELALTPDSKKPVEVEEISAVISLENLHKEAVSILASTPELSHTIKHLEENPEIEQWVQSGIHLHSDSAACEFCGNKLELERLNAFRAHFSKDLAAHKGKVNLLLQKIEDSELRIALPKPAELNSHFREAFENATIPLANCTSTFNQMIKFLAKEVQIKLENIYKPLKPSPISEGAGKSVVDAIDAINKIIRENNKLANNFIEERKAALHNARYQYVLQFMGEEKNTGYEKKVAVLKKRGNKIKQFYERLQHAVDGLQAEISQSQQGRERINERLASMLGSQAAQIKVTKDNFGQERFQLVRSNGTVAKNLSDGERTTIAFSYFLTKLQELKTDQFKQTIVYIDDPISSLDSNHIFQVTAAINNIFYHKPIDPAGIEGAWTTTCKQIFISTHNFEFFNLMRELKPDGKNAARLFLVKRISNGSSELHNLPKSLSSYSSEYQFLFDNLYTFYVSTDKTAYDSLMILPNALRRFVELYTFSRIPSTHRDTVDNRASELFGSERSKSILKFLHTFSHGNTIERISGNNDLIFILEQAVEDIFGELKEADKRHWDALVSAVKN